MVERKLAFIFPGQGAQSVGMAKDVVDAYGTARQTFEEADDILGRKLSDIVFSGPEAVLKKTHNSQVAIYVASIAIWRVFQELFPETAPTVCAGHSLGEYTALTASGRLSFADGLPLVQKRGQLMTAACDASRGGMAAIIGLDSDAVEALVSELAMPQDLWTANFNCPGQVVVSGTERGIEAAIAAAKEKGARRAIPLQVYGAFHSGLMASAAEGLAPHIKEVAIVDSAIGIVMNVTGDYVDDVGEIRELMISQVTSPVRWEQGVRAMMEAGVELFIELGPGKVLTGLAKRIGVASVGVEKVEEFSKVEQQLTVA